MRPLDLFIGWDARESVGAAVFVQSVLELATVPARITPLSSTVMATREGSNTFTWARFRVAELMGYQGRAIFVDGSDMLMRCDIAELADLFDDRYAVQVVKHDYRTRHPVKYVGSELECANVNYPRKQWASVMLINCAHLGWRNVTDSLDTLQLRMFADAEIGALPIEWNWIADEQGYNADARIIHFTCGIPAIAHYRDTPHSSEWLACRDRAFAAPKAKAVASIREAA